MRIDTRAGSQELIGPLKHLGIPVEPATLYAGDVEIIGQGPTGPTLVGVEVKTVADAAQCLKDGRFAEQARKMRESYDVRWLLVEGRIAGFEPGGQILLRSHEKWLPLLGRLSYASFAGWLLTMTQAGGMLLWQTDTRAETVAWLRGLNDWWTLSEWSEHRSHLAVYQAPLEGNPLKRPSQALTTAHSFPGLGGKRAEAVAAHFSTVRRLAAATPDEWKGIEGVGPKTIAAVQAALDEPHK